LSLALLVYRLSRPAVGVLVRDPASGAWGRRERHPDWGAPGDVVVAGVDWPLFYANAQSVKDRVLALVHDAGERPRAVVLELSQADIDLETLDMLGELADALAAERVELRLAGVRAVARPLLERSGVVERVTIEPTLDAAVR
jgi:sulfate permease, SulP family